MTTLQLSSKPGKDVAPPGAEIASKTWNLTDMLATMAEDSVIPRVYGDYADASVGHRLAFNVRRKTTAERSPPLSTQVAAASRVCGHSSRPHSSRSSSSSSGHRRSGSTGQSAATRSPPAMEIDRTSKEGGEMLFGKGMDERGRVLETVVGGSPGESRFLKPAGVTVRYPPESEHAKCLTKLMGVMRWEDMASLPLSTGSNAAEVDKSSFYVIGPVSVDLKQFSIAKKTTPVPVAHQRKFEAWWQDFLQEICLSASDPNSIGLRGRRILVAVEPKIGDFQGVSVRHPLETKTTLIPKPDLCERLWLLCQHSLCLHDPEEYPLFRQFWDGSRWIGLVVLVIVNQQFEVCIRYGPTPRDA